MPTAWPITMATAYVVARREGVRQCEITQDDGAIGAGGWAAYRRDGCQRGLPRRERRPYTAPTPWRCGWAPKRRAMPTHRSHRARPPGWGRVQRWRTRTASRCEWHYRATRRQGERRVQHVPAGSVLDARASVPRTRSGVGRCGRSDDKTRAGRQTAPAKGPHSGGEAWVSGTGCCLPLALAKH